ncbi:MAG: hypothetical protein WCJ07_12100 [Verrucomicrobiota bacterium]
MPPDLAGAGAAVGAAFVDCGLAALLEMTNLRRTGGVLVFATFGLLCLLPGLLLGAVALLFDINNQTKSTPVQEKMTTGHNNALLKTTRVLGCEAGTANTRRLTRSHATLFAANFKDNLPFFGFVGG